MVEFQVFNLQNLQVGMLEMKYLDNLMNIRILDSSVISNPLKEQTKPLNRFSLYLLIKWFIGKMIFLIMRFSSMLLKEE